MSEPKFAYEKIVGMPHFLYGDIPHLLDLIGRMMWSMKECNGKNNHQCEFFRLDFRPGNITDGLPRGALDLHLKWGCREDLEKNVVP